MARGPRGVICALERSCLADAIDDSQSTVTLRLMLPSDLRAWRRRIAKNARTLRSGYWSRTGAAKTLGIHLHEYVAYESGRWPDGYPAPIPKVVALACRALELDIYRGVPMPTPLFGWAQPTPEELQEDLAKPRRGGYRHGRRSAPEKGG